MTSDIESRDQIIADLSGRLDAAEARNAGYAAHTWQQERAEVVEWLRKFGFYHVATTFENGKHWPEGGNG